MIKGYRFRKLMWILIIMKFLDIMTTIYAINYLGAKELNPIGYDIGVIISIIYLFILFFLIKYYDKFKNLRISLQTKKGYNFIIYCSYFVLIFYSFVLINNFTQILRYILL